MKQAKGCYVSFLLQLILLLFAFGTGNAFAGPTTIDLSATTCLAKDIVTGPVGWECKTPSNSFIMTFFGVNRGAIGEKDITVNVPNCNSIEIRELGVSYTGLIAISGRAFTALKTLTGQVSVSIECEYIPPPNGPSTY